jgi:hypothetical protein
MTGKDFVWPWGMTEEDPDPSTRPWVFNPHGFLLAVLADTAEAERAGAALGEVGFGKDQRRIYSGEQVLHDRERFTAQQSAARKLVERVTVDNDVLHQLLEYARAGNAFLWVRVPDRADANRAIRGLSAHGVLYYRYYGNAGIEDIHMP